MTLAAAAKNLKKQGKLPHSEIKPNLETGQTNKPVRGDIGDDLDLLF